MGSEAERLERQADKRLAREQRRADKEHSTMTIIGRLTGSVTREPKAWKPPTLDAPLVIDPRELAPLGQIGIHAWHSHKLGELRERPDTLTDFDILPDRPIVQTKVDGERAYRVFEVFEPGSYAIAAAGPVPRESRPVRMQPIDGLDSLAITTVLKTSSGWKARGAVDILRRLESKGYRVTLSVDSASLVVEGDRWHPGVEETLARTGPLLLAHLRGETLACAVSAHKTPAPATTINLGGTPWCGECKP